MFVEAKTNTLFNQHDCQCLIQSAVVVVTAMARHLRKCVWSLFVRFLVFFLKVVTDVDDACVFQHCPLCIVRAFHRTICAFLSK
ncbi:hypothetical protein T4D_6274 [Trichinella pseudospiralis]|uniref:Uncharacterized protein n=1 Tax=Trichinella pseudospiralis TaxID=6337 RepID=A0A0V1FVW1_TRIPS|nr:hypothetical protein T4D_6274 [Trichinella pseudospiralis]